jgi:hypothetical protein
LLQNYQLGDQVKVQVQVQESKKEENKKEQVHEIKSMHDNFSRPVDFHSV